MKHILIVVILTVFMIGSLQPTKAQLIDLKPWNGTYPDMGGTYPLTFISFSGGLIPVPHVFIRLWPAHYYYDVISIPVTDAEEFAGELKNGLLRILAKALERSQMKGRMEETEQIKVNTDYSQQISDQLFDARSDELSDIYNLAAGFIKLYQKVNRLGTLENSGQIHSIYEKEADHLLMQFLTVNLFQTDHGSKLEAFTGISHDLNKLLGEVDYTHGKLHYFNSFDKQPQSYSFLTR